jgi:hypothetical protein
MTRPLFLLTLLTACPTPKSDDTADTAACAPSGDLVPAGVYGGTHYQLTVAADGSAELLGDCSRATVAQATVASGAVHWDLTWQSGYGLPVQDTASIEYIDVTLDGTLCGSALDATLTFPDASTADIHVVLGADADLYYCD